MVVPFPINQVTIALCHPEVRASEPKDLNIKVSVMAMKPNCEKDLEILRCAQDDIQ